LSGIAGVDSCWVQVPSVWRTSRATYRLEAAWPTAPSTMMLSSPFTIAEVM
jgi:hypothetical protein